MHDEYERNGFLLLKNFYNETELKLIRHVVREFHLAWCKKNTDFYEEKAVNSAYLTSTQYLPAAQRQSLFMFIGSAKLMSVVNSVMKARPSFMNTQLFFNPVNEEQKNYWHRDPQYHLTLEEQKEALSGPDVIHFRIPLVDEPGIELIPETHKRWDTKDELDVRLEKNGRKHYDELTTGLKISLEAGDLLVFSANMIHRGLYGLDRLSLDILFCDPEQSFVKFIDADCLPSQAIMNTLENADAFERTLELKYLDN